MFNIYAFFETIVLDIKVFFHALDRSNLLTQYSSSRETYIPRLYLYV